MKIVSFKPLLINSYLPTANPGFTGDLSEFGRISPI